MEKVVISGDRALLLDERVVGSATIADYTRMLGESVSGVRETPLLPSNTLFYHRDDDCEKLIVGVPAKTWRSAKNGETAMPFLYFFLAYVEKQLVCFRMVASMEEIGDTKVQLYTPPIPSLPSYYKLVETAKESLAQLKTVPLTDRVRITINMLMESILESVELPKDNGETKLKQSEYDLNALMEMKIP